MSDWHHTIKHGMLTEGLTTVKPEYCMKHPHVARVVLESTSVNGGSIGYGCAICNLAARDVLLKAAEDVLPLLSECDCIYSDREHPLCPCRALRAAVKSLGLSSSAGERQ